ncbi:MAG: hypothetical protein ACXWF8_03130 [Methylobacter sp.]
MNKLIQVFMKGVFIAVAAVSVTGCPMTVNLNVATDKPIALAVDKPVELKLSAGIAITELPPIKVTTLPPVKVGLAKDKNK